MIRPASLLLALALALPATTQGQSIFLTRPAKGQAITVFNAATGNVTSTVLDMSAFESIIVYGSCAATCSTMSVNATGASTPGGTYTALSDPNAAFLVPAGTSFSYALSNLSPFVKLALATPSVATTLVVVPVPFSIRKEVSGSVKDGAPLVPVGSDAPVIVGGMRVDGLVVHHIIVPDTNGQAIQGSGTAGAPAGGVVSVQGVSGGTGLPVTNGNTSTKETPHAASPISVTGNNTIILDANASRHTASLQNLGTSAVYFCYHATTCSSAAYDFVLGFPGGTTGAGAMSTSYTIGPQSVVWSGGITAGGTAGSIAVSAY